MAGRIDSYANNLSKINPHVSTAQETAKKLNIDKSIIEKAADKLGVEVLLADPACRNYFKTMGQSLQTLTTRHWEIDFKADAARIEDPRTYMKAAFLDRDTSQGQIYQDKIPDLTEGLVKRWEEIGFLKPKQAEAMQKIFFSTIAEADAESLPVSDDDEYAQFLESFSRGEETSVQAQRVEINSGTPSDNSRGHTVSMGLTRDTRIQAPPSRPGSQSNILGGRDPVAAERATLDSYFTDDDSAKGWLSSLLDSESRSREAVSGFVMDLQTINQRKREIMAELSGINTNTEEGRKQFSLTQFKLNDVQDSERQLTDQMQNVLRWRTERIEMISKILEMNSLM